MIELIQMAEKRRDLLQNKLADHKTEMDKLQAELDKLDTFVGLGRELFESDTPAARTSADKVHARREPEPLPETPAPRTMPARQSRIPSTG